MILCLEERGENVEIDTRLVDGDKILDIPNWVLSEGMLPFS